MSWLLARPAWVWLLLAVVVYAGVQEYRIRRLHARMDDAKLEQMAREREAVRADVSAIRTQRTFLDQAVQRSSAEVGQLKRDLAAVKTDLAKREGEAKRLVESGTVADVVRAGQALGYHPVAHPRLP